MTNTINFQHKYHKLESAKYTTIRGKTKALQYRVGEKVPITVNRKHIHDALIKEISISRICDIGINLLRRDAAYNSKTITSKQDFVDLLNSFYPRSRFPNRRASLDSEVAIIWLEVVS